MKTTLKSLLATAAAVALLAGPAMAQRQEAPASDAKGAAPAPQAIQNAPAEKVAPPMNKSAPAVTGQATPGGKPGSTEMKAQSETRTGTDIKTGAEKPGMKADTKSGADTKSRASGPDTKAPATAQGQGSPGGSVALTTEQKTKIRSSVLTGNAPRVTNVNFSINVGTVVPRTVRLVTVPATLVEIHPAWRGYMYFVHGDEIVIVEPGTMKIVTVIAV
jgi:hypothetical protein